MSQFSMITIPYYLWWKNAFGENLISYNSLWTYMYAGANPEKNTVLIPNVQIIFESWFPSKQNSLSQ